MNKYLLDTNICIFAFRDQYGINERMLHREELSGDHLPFLNHVANAIGQTTLHRVVKIRYGRVAQLRLPPRILQLLQNLS